MNTSGKVWFVCRQFYDRGERFKDNDEALRYAEILAKKLGGEHVEVFECTSNLKVDLPVAVMTKEESTDDATARKVNLEHD